MVRYTSAILERSLNCLIFELPDPLRGLERKEQARGGVAPSASLLKKEIQILASSTSFFLDQILFEAWLSQKCSSKLSGCLVHQLPNNHLGNKIDKTNSVSRDQVSYQLGLTFIPESMGN